MDRLLGFPLTGDFERRLLVLSLLPLLLLALVSSLSAANLRQQVKGLWDERDYDALDALYSEFSQREFAIWDSYPDLIQFFDILSPYSRQSDGWQEAISGIEAWREARPDSIAAVLALARVYENWAWNARGSGYADTVAEEQWEQFT